MPKNRVKVHLDIIVKYPFHIVRKIAMMMNCLIYDLQYEGG